MDKDNLLKPFDPPSDKDYLPKPPSDKAFFNCCNEFWWVCPYVAKGLWRNELTYAKYMFDRILRAELLKMLIWRVGVKTRFSLNPGKFGSRLRLHLEPELWRMLEKTYSDGSCKNTWKALHVTCDLFRIAAMIVADHFEYCYPNEDDAKVTSYLKHIQFLPTNSEKIY
jgi:aminoglycoside 6-adenylyltransferase